MPKAFIPAVSHSFWFCFVGMLRSTYVKYLHLILKFKFIPRTLQIVPVLLLARIFPLWFTYLLLILENTRNHQGEVNRLLIFILFISS